MPPPLEERVAALEQSYQEGREEHREIAEALDHLKTRFARMEVYLANGNGGFTLSVKNRRVRFAGSLSLPWLMGIMGGGSGGGWVIGRLFGAW